MLRANYKKQILKFYNEFLLSSSINSPGSVAWSSEESQINRFKVLYDVGITKDDTVLDLGCGLGHMVDFHSKLGYNSDNYLGVDINPNYIIYAIQRNPNVKFITGEIYDVSDNYDYVVGSGVFTIKMALEEVFDAIDASFRICNKGLAFNFINEGFINEPGFNTFNPKTLYDTIKKKYNNIKLVSHYLGDEDFTIYIYK
jgi:SAM-dependent methyltransferase